MPYLTDTHCHLFLDQFAEDLPAVIERAQEAGVTKILVPGIDLETSRQAIELSQKHENIFAAVGIHPNTPGLPDEATWNALYDLAVLPEVVAIGEIGLDNHWDTQPAEAQISVLTKQLDLAADLQKPVIIHNREADQEIWSILSNWQTSLVQQGNPLASRPGVMHSFSGDLSFAGAIQRQNFFISLSGPITFLNARDLASVAGKVKLDRLVVETDAPYLAPHPHRGRRNEPAYVKLIAEKLSELQGKTLDSIAEITTRNADTLFSWRSSD